MNRIVRIVSGVSGILLLILGGYISIIEYIVQNQLARMKQGIVNHSKIREVEALPFAPKYLLEYNASLTAYRSKDIIFALNSLSRIANETKNKEIKFRAYLLLAHVYLDWIPENHDDKNGIGTEYAINMCINALELKPDAYHAKHLLERLLNQMRVQGEKKKQSELKQQLPKDDNVRVWSIIPKGDAY